MRNKTIVFLGGAAPQLVAVERAKDMGYRTVVCDMDPNVPGATTADHFYEVSTTDLDGIISVVRGVGASGVVAYATDRAASTAALAARACGLPGNDPDAVATFCDKGRFREFLSKNGFAVPRSQVVRAGDVPDLSDMRFPLIVKPTDSAGSRGVSVVRERVQLVGALELATSFSRNGRLIVEEYVERSHLHTIGLELYAVSGEVVTWGLMNCVRDPRVNELVPGGESLPLELGRAEENLLRQEVSRLVSLSGILTSAFNMEAVIDERGEVYFLDAGPRSGGNMLPQFIQMASGADMISATIEASVGETPDVDSLCFDGHPAKSWGQAVLHSVSDGRFSGVRYGEEAKKCLVEEHIYAQLGDEVRRFSTAGDALGIAFFRCEDLAQTFRVLEGGQIEVCLE